MGATLVSGPARSLLPSLSLAFRRNRVAKDQRDLRDQKKKKKVLSPGARPQGQEGRLQAHNSGSAIFRTTEGLRIYIKSSCISGPGPGSSEHAATSRGTSQEMVAERKASSDGGAVDGLEEQGRNGGNPGCRGCFSILPHLLGNYHRLFSVLSKLPSPKQDKALPSGSSHSRGRDSNSQNIHYT